MKRAIACEIGSPFDVQILLEISRPGFQVSVVEVTPTELFLKASKAFLMTSDDSAFQTSYAPPLAIVWTRSALLDLEAKLEKHIDAGYLHYRPYDEVSNEHLTELQWMIHKAIVDLAIWLSEVRLMRTMEHTGLSG